MVISECGQESDFHGEQMKPFSRPMSGITLERIILPDIEKHQNPVKEAKLESRNN